VLSLSGTGLLCFLNGVSPRWANAGEFYWVGAASTTFWVDPKEGIVCIFLSQLRPWTLYNYMREVRAAVNQAVCDKPWAKM
jgi:CubicO group peptidase (beta-lactamase class C family)